jgi:hypothetical protein
MNSYQRIAAFADDHYRPKPSVVTADGVVIFSEEVHADGTVVVVSDKVTTMGEARAVLGY